MFGTSSGFAGPLARAESQPAAKPEQKPAEGGFPHLQRVLELHVPPDGFHDGFDRPPREAQPFQDGLGHFRADALVLNPILWVFLKGALRDGEIRIEEFYRANSPPLAGAPKPVPVPIDINVVIVGAPQWYYAFFAQDPDFQSYFKVKAEIEPTADATYENLCNYAGLIASNARSNGIEVSRDGIGRLLGREGIRPAAKPYPLLQLPQRGIRQSVPSPSVSTSSFHTNHTIIPPLQTSPTCANASAVVGARVDTTGAVGRTEKHQAHRYA